MVVYPVNAGDRVRVQFNKDGVSYIHSDNDHDVHFTGIKVSDVNEKSAGYSVTAPPSTSTSRTTQNLDFK